jgi:hypothetical protein
VFVNIVKRKRPNLYTVSKALEAWLGLERIAGGPINSKQILSIEAEGPATIYKVEEVEDSEEEDSVDLVEDRDKSNLQDNTAQPKQL